MKFSARFSTGSTSTDNTCAQAPLDFRFHEALGTFVPYKLT